jgi:hypothetical protein
MQSVWPQVSADVGDLPLTSTLVHRSAARSTKRLPGADGKRHAGKIDRNELTHEQHGVMRRAGGIADLKWRGRPRARLIEDAAACEPCADGKD